MSWFFLNHAALWAAPLAMVPVLLHFLFKKPPKTVSFSDLRLLKSVVRRAQPRKRLHHWLLLLARVLALLFLFIFFSRPVMHRGSQGSSTDSLAMVFLLDASYSMQGGGFGVTGWDRALATAEKAAKALSRTDRSAAVVFSDQIAFNSGSLTDRHEELIRKMREFKPTDRTTNFLPPLQAAFRVLANSGASNKSIMILSDLAAHGWTDGAKNLETAIKDFDPNVNLILLKHPPAGKNLAVRNVRISPDFSENRVLLSAEIENAGLVPVEQSSVFLESGSPPRREAESSVSLRPGETGSVSLTAPLREGEPIFGKVAVPADQLNADNEFFFAHQAAEKIRVLCVEEPSGIQALSGESYFFRESLLAPPSPFEVGTVNMSEIKKQALMEFDVIVLVNPGEIDPDSMALLSAFQKRGGALFLGLGDRTASSALSGLFPARFGDERETGGLQVQPRGLEEDQASSDFISGYNWDKVRIGKIVQPLIDESAVPLLAFSDGTPLLIFDRDRKSAVWMSTLGRQWNNFASKPAYAPFMRFLIGKLARKDLKSVSDSLRVGESLRRRFEKGSGAESFELISPFGKEVSLKASYNEIVSEPLEERGFYLFRRRNHPASFERLPVNVDSRKGESSVAATPDSELDLLFPRSKKRWIDTGEKFETQFISLLRGKELTRVFLFLAGLFLILEMVLSGRRLKAATAALLLFMVGRAGASGVLGNRFVLAQLKAGKEEAGWDPYPLVSGDILSFLTQTTSVKTLPDRRVVALEDPLLFQSPFLLFSGSGKWSLSKNEREILKKYISGGGFFFIEDRAGEKGGSFDHSFRAEMKKMFYEKSLNIIPRDHAVFRSFYLLRTVGGRRLTNNYLEGLEVDGRVAVLYSQNDILGAWAKDLLGNFVFKCSPGDELQRWESQKLMMNIILYSVTGTYKSDMIHHPFIEEKLKN